MSKRSTETPATWALPAVVFMLAAALYALLSTLTEVPVVAPDEFLYGHLARSVGSGDGLTWYGIDQPLRTALYVYAIAPSWALASGESAYGIAKLIGAVTACAVVFPTWVLARRVMPARTALIPAGLAVAGTWMITAGGLLSENLAYPLATTALVTTVLALREPARRWIWIAFTFAVLATLARAQLAVLFPIMLGALALDVALAEQPPQRVQRHRAPLAVLAVVTFAGLIVVLAGSSSLLGYYADVSDFAPPLGRVLSATGEQWIALAIMCGALPLAALIAIGAQRPAWRDRDVGPLLCVTVPTILLLLLESGYFNAGVGDDGLGWSIERYVQYAVPLLLILLFAALQRGLLTVRPLLIAGAALTLTLFAAGDVSQVVEERARFATGDLLGGMDAGFALPLAAVLVIGAAALALRRTAGPRTALYVGGALLALLVLQSGSIWRWQVDVTQQIRAQFPERLTWVNDNAPGAVSRMYLFQNSALFQTAELFNDAVEQDLGPSVEIPGLPPTGPLCSWTASPRGVVQPSDDCRPLRSTVWNDDPFILMSFHGGRFLARDPMLGQLIAVPAEPRLRSMIRQPCQRTTLLLDESGSPTDRAERLPCQPNMSISLWLDSPGDLRLTFSGGRRPQRVQIGERSWRLPAGRPTTITVPLNTAAPRLTVGLDWTARRGVPKLIAAELVGGDRREPLL